MLNSSLLRTLVAVIVVTLPTTTDVEPPKFSEFQRWFYEQYILFNPGEGILLGDSAATTRLKDLSAFSDEVAFYAETSKRLDLFSADDLTVGERIDAWTIRQIAEHLRSLYTRRQDHLRNLDWGVYPHNLLQYLVVGADGWKDWSRIADLIEQIPRYLAQQEINLLDGRKKGHTIPKVQTLEVLATLREIPNYFFRELETVRPKDLPAEERIRLSAAARQAGMSYHRHYHFVRRELVPTAGSDFALGRTEYVRRVRRMGITEPLEDLVKRAGEDLRGYHSRMFQLAREIAPGRDFSTWKDIARLLTELRADHPETTNEVLDVYHTVSDRL